MATLLHEIFGQPPQDAGRGPITLNLENYVTSMQRCVAYPLRWYGLASDWRVPFAWWSTAYGTVSPQTYEVGIQDVERETAWNSFGKFINQM